MAPSLLVYFIPLCLGTFFTFMAVMGFIMIMTGAMLVIAYQRGNYKLISILRIVLVLTTLAAFINTLVCSF